MSDGDIVDVYLEGSREPEPLVMGPVLVDAEEVRNTFNKLFEHAFHAGLSFGKRWDEREQIDQHVTIGGVVVEPPKIHDVLKGSVLTERKKRL